MEYAWTSTSTRLTTSQLAPYLDVFNQYNRDVASAWGVPPWVCSVYADVSKLPIDDTIPAVVVDSLDDPQAAAYHTLIGDRPDIRSLPDDLWDAGTHEMAEARHDPTCDIWVLRPDGTQIAGELCDPFQGHGGYQIGGQRVACFALPPFFDVNGKGPFCACGQAKAPFVIDPGGYAVVLDAAGNEQQTFGRLEYGPGTAGHFAAALKLAKRNSRLLRRLRGR